MSKKEQEDIKTLKQIMTYLSEEIELLQAQLDDNYLRVDVEEVRTNLQYIEGYKYHIAVMLGRQKGLEITRNTIAREIELRSDKK